MTTRKLTKREQARKFKADWQKALEEGRVVRYLDGSQMQSFLTIEDRDFWLRGTGRGFAEIVRLPKKSG